MSNVAPPPPYKRPSLLPWAASLGVTDARFPWVKPTFDEENIVAVLEAVHVEHYSEAEAPDNAGWLSPWGTCVACANTWPCAAWNDADRLGRIWAGRAADRYAGRADVAWHRLLEQRKEKAA